MSIILFKKNESKTEQKRKIILQLDFECEMHVDKIMLLHGILI